MKRAKTKYRTCVRNKRRQSKKKKKETKVIENEKLQEESHRARVLTLSREFPFFFKEPMLVF